MTDTTIEGFAAGAKGPRKIIAFLHSTLDGFIANSDGTFWERFPWGATEMEWNNEQFRQADTWILGRVMYEAIVPWWTAVASGSAPSDAPGVSMADREFAALLNDMTKIVISTTLDARHDRQVIASDVPRRLEMIKRQPGAHMMLSCGPALLSELAQQPGLIDEYLLVIHPTAIGTGVPLFAPLTRELHLGVPDVMHFEGGAVALRYRVVSD